MIRILAVFAVFAALMVPAAAQAQDVYLKEKDGKGAEPIFNPAAEPRQGDKTVYKGPAPKKDKTSLSQMLEENRQADYAIIAEETRKAAESVTKATADYNSRQGEIMKKAQEEMSAYMKEHPEQAAQMGLGDGEATAEESEEEKGERIYIQKPASDVGAPKKVFTDYD